MTRHAPRRTAGDAARERFREADVRRLGVVGWLACGSVLVGAWLPGSIVSAGASLRAVAASSPRCALRALAAWGGPSTGAAGSIAGEFGFTNRSTRTCSLFGFPRINMLDASGGNISTLDRTAPGAFGIAAKTVVLAPGATAYFGVEYASQTGFATLRCPKSVALRITPPQVAGSLTLRAPAARIAPYGGTTKQLECGIVHVSAVTAKRFE